MENNNVKIWDKIAESFAATRTKPWDECVKFIDKLPRNSTALDLACGNGRHLLPAAVRCREVVGGDISRKLLNIAQTQIGARANVELIQLDARSLPFKNNSFDFVLFVASLHNIRGRDNRIQALKEVRRVLKKGGKVFITVWARWQDRWRYYFFKEMVMVPINLFRGKEFGDILVPWKRNGMNLSRFYHLYARRELEKDSMNAGFIIEESKSVHLKTARYPDNHMLTAIK
jgi:ubiquinone/menaquinone biosynthesis C-methylase UbiE